MPPSALQNTAASNARHWRRTKTLTFSLMLIWVLVTVFVIFFARELSSFTVFGWPLSFYMAAQGLVVIYLIIVAVYTWQMGRFDRDAGIGKTAQHPHSPKPSQTTSSDHALNNEK
ncbi:DUF4212 domain-containing protein [Glaciimonas sp. PCH181]|uniref:DUF4212 domain-containing protein n=1 Tax=Glaciimonas sp. PCH181 TaxID=2133943 RepID=UPI000D35F9D6|nr:DUF4212 domain-containing protein [Glaciimonas sp. PCH181]PUA17415.1 DUF4212 domain-containing protein [Glaciimonas sp. PCH181]